MKRFKFIRNFPFYHDAAELLFYLRIQTLHGGSPATNQLHVFVHVCGGESARTTEGKRARERERERAREKEKEREIERESVACIYTYIYTTYIRQHATVHIYYNSNNLVCMSKYFKILAV